MKAILSIALIFCCAAVVQPSFFFGADAKQRFSLTMKMAGQNPGQICISARPIEPFEVVWTSVETTTYISGEIQSPKGRRFPLEMVVSRRHGQRQDYDRLGYDLKLGVPAEHPVVVTSRNHPKAEDPEITLANTSCFVQ